MNVLGLHIFGHHTGAALCNADGIVAISEERLTRVKQDTAFPLRSIRYCLDHAGIELDDVDLVVYDRAMGRSEALRLPANFRRRLDWYDERRLLGVDHHVLHAWSACAMAGVEEAAVLVVDGGGSLIEKHRAIPRLDNGKGAFLSMAETMKASMYRYSGGRLERIKYLTDTPGIGALYATVTEYVGFGKLDAGKTMGLAAYSTGATDIPSDLLFTEVEDRGFGDLLFEYGPASYDVDGLTAVLGRPPRDPSEPLPDDFYTEVAGFAQRACERWVLRAADHLARLTGSPNLVMSGGVALNCRANQLVEEAGLFERCFFHPLAADNGIPHGAAVYGWHRLAGGALAAGADSPYLGRRYGTSDVAAALDRVGRPLEVVRDDLPRRVAERLARGEAVGMCVGRSEAGMRALGGRSILADPRSVESRDRLNARVKKREPWRPFGPAVAPRRYRDLFDGDPRSRAHMNAAANVRPAARAEIAGTVHVDGTARPQVVAGAAPPLLAEVIERFEALTGVGAVVNTSLNLAGDPIVETPEDALDVLRGPDMDALVLEDALVAKA